MLRHIIRCRLDLRGTSSLKSLNKSNGFYLLGNIFLVIFSVECKLNVSISHIIRKNEAIYLSWVALFNRDNQCYIQRFNKS